MRTLGQRCARVSATSATVSTRCSQLSSTSSALWSRSTCTRDSSVELLEVRARPQDLGDHPGHCRRIADGGQLDEPDAVARAVEHLRGRLQGEARLARAARAGEGDQARLLDERANLGNLGRSARRMD